MNPEDAAVINNARVVASRAAGAIVEVDALIAVLKYRPLSTDEQGRGLGVLRELLVLTTQQDTLLEWAVGVRRAPWWSRWWMRLRGLRGRAK